MYGHDCAINITVSVVGKRAPLPMGKRGPTPQDKCTGGRQTARPLPHEFERARLVPPADPTPVRDGLGSGRSERPGKVPCHLGEDIRPVEKLYRAGDPKDYRAALSEPARNPRKGTASP